MISLIAESCPYRNLRHQAGRWLGLACLFGIVGCGGNGVVSISPTFTMDGAPLAEASVTFVRTDGEQGRASFGVTDSQGVAQLTTYEPFDGVMPGSYKVVVIKAPKGPAVMEQFTEPEPGDTEALIRMSAMSGMIAQPQARARFKRTLLPEVYSDPGTTPLSCTITSAGDSPAFEIDSKL